MARLLPQTEDIRAEKGRRHLRDFIAAAWHVVEPATVFVPGWHIDCICDHLEACARGEIRLLDINIPPRHQKSLTVSVFFPAWTWIDRPETRWLFTSYAESLAVRDSLKTRRVILSPWYQRHFGDRYQLATDQNVKIKFENDHTGFRMATGVGGANTGEGGDFIVADDPNNVNEAESAAVREYTNTWWDETMSTRGNDPKTAVHIIIQQRTHEEDLTGHVLSKELGYHHLCLPARYEPRVQIQPGMEFVAAQPHDSCPIHQDPRTEDGELLWPDRFGEAELQVLEKTMDTYAASGQLQQRPVPREGSVFRSEWFRPLPRDFDRNALTAVVQYWDLAWSEQTSADYVAGVTMGVGDHGDLYILHVDRERIGADGLAWAIAESVAIQRPDIVALEEGAYQQPATRELMREVGLILDEIKVASAVKGIPAKGNKVVRWQLPATRAQHGGMFADRTAPWWQTFEAELLKVPKGAHDDQADALAGATQLAIEGIDTSEEQRSSYRYTRGAQQAQQDADTKASAFFRGRR